MSRACSAICSSICGCAQPWPIAPAASWLTLHYCALELGVNSEFWEAKATTFWEKFQASYSQLVPDLLLDLDEDNQISTGERKMGITSGELLR